MSKIKLEWGQTPWDDLPREELLRELQRYHSALESAAGVLRDCKLGNQHPYWTEGPGGKAIEKAKQVTARLANYDSGEVYRRFFRYADDLLFDGLGDDWMACDQCKALWSRIIPKGEPLTTQTCNDCARKGIVSRLRPITWDDLGRVAAKEDR